MLLLILALSVFEFNPQVHEELRGEVHIEAEEEKQDIKESKEKRASKSLKPYNLPPKQSTMAEVDTGNMVVVREKHKVKLGEIIEVDEDEVNVHWFGTKSSKSSPRRRWKFYPMWTDRQTGVREPIKASSIKMEATTNKVGRGSILLAFTKLNLNATVPEEVLSKIESYDFN